MAATPNLGFYAVVIVLAIVAPEVAAFGFLVIAIVAVLRAHGDQKAQSKNQATLDTYGGDVILPGMPGCGKHARVQTRHVTDRGRGS